MIKKLITTKTSISLNQSDLGETIEQKVERIVYTNEKIDDGVQTIYIARKDGILPQYDIRTDRFEIALNAITKANKSEIAKRDNAIVETNYNKNENKNVGKNADKNPGETATKI